MRYKTFLLAAILPLVIGSFTKPKVLTITSSAFTANGPIPAKYTCMGAEASPPLHIDGIPEGTKSLAVIVFDPDAETKVIDTQYVNVKPTNRKDKRIKTARNQKIRIVHGFTHWIMWNLETSPDIPENFRSDHTGLNGAMERAYKGMCPPSGTHHYQFIIYALDTQLNIDVKCGKDGLEKIMDGHVLAKGILVGTFNKSYR